MFLDNSIRALNKSSFPDFYSHTISAGFPSPADDYCGGSLDLNEFLVPRPESTLFVRVPDNSMSKYGLFRGDLLIIDRSLKAREGKLVVLRYQGELIVRKISSGRAKPPVNDSQVKQLEDSHENSRDLEGIGVVKARIRRFKV